MFKHIILTSLLLSTLSYGEGPVANTTPNADTATQSPAKSAAQAFNDKRKQIPAPKVSDIPLEYPRDKIALSQQTAETFQTKIEFTPTDNAKTYYFDKDGNVTEKPSAGGFYRKILGTTDSGRVVGQDFYQDSKTPQTAPFVFIEGADLDNFSTNQNDGEVVWFGVDGAIKAASTLNNGKTVYGMQFCDKGHICSQWNDKLLVVYYDNSDKVLMYIQGRLKNELTTLTFFREDDSSAIYQLSLKDKSELAWDKSGKSIDPKTISSEVEALFKKIKSFSQYL